MIFQKSSITPEKQRTFLFKKAKKRRKKKGKKSSMVRCIFFEESPNSKVAIRVGILAISYLALRSLIYNFIYPTGIFIFYTILQLCGMLLEFLMAPFHVVGSNLMISPFGYVIKGLFLEISSNFPFNLVLFLEKVPV